MPVTFSESKKVDSRTCVSWCRSKSKLLSALPFIGDAKEWVNSDLLERIDPKDIKKYPLGDVIGVLPNHEEYGHMVRLEDYENGFYVGTQLTNEGVIPFRYIGDEIVVLTPKKQGKKSDDTKSTKEAKEQELLDEPKEVLDEPTIQEVVDTKVDEASEKPRKAHEDDSGLGGVTKPKARKSTKRATKK